MLQYLTQPETRYSIAEQCQMVIEGGCGWIQLHIPDHDEGAIRELATELVPLCKETATILMLENQPTLAKELGLHGVHLTLNSGINAASLREEFGPEAIIGVEVTEASSILALKGADIDYVTLPSYLGIEKQSEIVRMATEAGNEMPIVFEGDYRSENVNAPIRVGASGVCTGKFIAAAHDPEKETEEMISALMSSK